MTGRNTPIKFPFPDPPSLEHPGPELRMLAEDGSVVAAELPDGTAAWLVAGFEEVRQVALDPRFSRTAPLAAPRTAQGEETFSAGSINGAGPPMHPRLRKLLASTFTARRVEELRPRVTGIVDELIQGIRARPRPVDLVSAFSLPLPLRVICEMLGVPLADLEQLHTWSDAVMGTQARQQESMAALIAIYGYFAKLIELKRSQPADDLMSALIAARDETGGLSEEELVMLGGTLVIGGHETTVSQINLSLVALFTHPGELARLRAEPELIPGAVEELMRYVRLSSGVPPARVTTEEVRLGGVTIPAGEVVLPFFYAANHDPSAFADPDQLDLSRAPCNHLGFGVGLHHCLGAQLARMELQEAYRGLLGQLPGLRLAVSVDELRLKPNMSIVNLCELPITWDET
ncbi:MAG TPA: cytochrome P450 [Streptosporangiaceae bacterium]